MFQLFKAKFSKLKYPILEGFINTNIYVLGFYIKVGTLNFVSSEIVRF